MVGRRGRRRREADRPPESRTAPGDPKPPNVSAAEAAPAPTIGPRRSVYYVGGIVFAALAVLVVVAFVKTYRRSND